MRVSVRVFSAVLALSFMSLTISCERKRHARVPPPPEVIVSRPAVKEVTDYLEFTGTSAALEYVRIRARVEGWLESMHFQPGSRVKKGDLLFVIDPRPFQARVDLQKAKLKGREADLKLKVTNLRRAAELLQTASISELQYDVHKAEEGVAEAQVGIAEAELEKAKLDLAYTQVTAPVSGRVSRNFVDVGNLVGGMEKTLLTEVVNDDSIYVYFDVSERELLKIKRMTPEATLLGSIRTGQAPAYLQLADEAGFPHGGKIDFAEPKVDPGTGTLQARAVFPNEKGLLIAGLFARIRVPLSTGKALLVPDLAVGVAQAGKYVLVVNKDDVVEQRLVKTGPADGTLRVIKEGVTKEDRVVINGIQRARPGRKVKPKESAGSSTPHGPHTEKPSSGK